MREKFWVIIYSTEWYWGRKMMGTETVQFYGYKIMIQSKQIFFLMLVNKCMSGRKQMENCT